MTIAETMDISEREMIPVAVTIIIPLKEYWLRQGIETSDLMFSNHVRYHPELLGSAF